MYDLSALGDFLLSSWIWLMTFDWMHPVVAGISMFFLLRILLRRKRIKSFAIALSLQLFATGLLTFIVGSRFIASLALQFDSLSQQQALAMLHEFYPSLSLGLIFSLFQTLYFLIGKLFIPFRAIGFIACVWLSNGIAFGISVLMIRTIQAWYYGV